jgi:hypothetical protein
MPRHTDSARSPCPRCSCGTMRAMEGRTPERMGPSSDARHSRVHGFLPRMAHGS